MTSALSRLVRLKKTGKTVTLHAPYGAKKELLAIAKQHCQYPFLTCKFSVPGFTEIIFMGNLTDLQKIISIFNKGQ